MAESTVTKKLGPNPTRKEILANWTPEEAEAFKAPVRQMYEDEGKPYYATARLWDDGIIDPVQTRDVLGLAFAATMGAPVEERGFGVFRM